jgi:hypothetical protein
VLEDQGCRSLGVRGREEHRHDAAVERAVDGSSFGSCVVQHRANVVHPLLERGQRLERHGIGEPDPSLVEDDDPAERSEAPEELRHERDFPPAFDVALPGSADDEIHRPIAEYLIGDVHFAATSEPGFRDIHARSVS